MRDRGPRGIQRAFGNLRLKSGSTSTAELGPARSLRIQIEDAVSTTITHDKAKDELVITIGLTEGSAIVHITDNTTGAASDALSDGGVSYTRATINSNFATVAAKINAILSLLEGRGLLTP